MSKNYLHRLVGARGAANVFSDQFSLTTNSRSPIKGRAPNFGKVFENPSEEIARHRLVFLGEIHSMPPIVEFQRQVQQEMHKRASNLHVFLEHFSFELQPLLNEFCEGRIDFENLNKKYHELGHEGHDLVPYKGLLEDARNKGIMLHAGFAERGLAKKFIKEDPKEALQDMSQWLKLPMVGLEGSEFHYNVFESLITGRSIYGQETEEPTDQFRRIFNAQIFKDVAMATKINEFIAENSKKNDDESKTNEKYLVIAGNGHFLHYCGVPERVLSAIPAIADESCLVISASTEEPLDEVDQGLSEVLKDNYGDEGSNPSDYVLLYQLTDDEEVDVKEETRKAYDKVGESAGLPGNKLKAAWIMYNMGYTEEQFRAAGSDVYNFQGVGNPHIHACIQPGERVLDVGSGLGIDSFIASQSVGPDGEVIGIDISSKEVKHAQAKAQTYELDKTHFVVADMENIPIADNSVDVIISNGAFCLAPNKEKAFQELFRVLKPGGRMSVCTTSTKIDNLEPGVSWPLCMKMFVSQKDLEPMCEKIGFVNILVDDSDSSMTMEIPEEVLQTSNPERNKVHVGSSDFKHLENYDMDQICARVCVLAFKPFLGYIPAKDLFPRSR